MLLILIPLALLVHNSLAHSLYDDIDDYHLWADERPVATASNQECKKDILVLWDCSSSIGFNVLAKKIIPFLIGLVNNSKMNVNQEGTHIGFISFSTKNKTKVLKGVGEMQDPEELRNWLKQYTKKAFFDSKYTSEQLGRQTYTGEAFKLANEVFAKESPKNYRDDVPDVILLFTDGRPNPNGGAHNEIPVAEKYSKILKEKKKVKIVGLAAGSKDSLSRYSDQIKKFSSEPSTKYFFESNINNVNSMVDKLVGPLCILSGIICKCDSYTFDVYTGPGQTEALVDWPEPKLSCSKPVDYNTVKPDITLPARFSRGPRSIAYSFWFVDGGKRTDFKCFVNFTVVDDCKCPETQTKYGKVAPGDKTVSISWTEPKPNCPTSASEDNPQRTNKEFTVGKHTLKYTYTHKSSYQEFNMECRVKIEVSGEFCGETVYEPATHVCCCGNTSEKKSGYQCCRQNYYNPNEKICCQNGIVAPLDSHCPP